MLGGEFGDAAKVPELRGRVFFTIFVLLIYRLGVFVPTPGIDADRLKELFEQSSSSLFGMVNMFSGGALENFSVFALGIMPYISVSIMMQLLGSFSKRLEDLREQGEQGRRIINRYTRFGTVALALIQGSVIAYGLESQGVVLSSGPFFRIITPLTLTAGTVFLMWIGEQITEKGIGNGISLIIMAGIVARMPSALNQTFGLVRDGAISSTAILLVLIFAVLTVVFIVYVERAQRQIPVQYPRRAVGKGKMTQAGTQYLPLKLNSAGVIPPIFASALLIFPVTILEISKIEGLQSILAFLMPPHPVYYFVFGFLIIFFCYFWIATVPDFNPNKIAERIKENGGFIPSVRPGKDTAEYLNAIMSKLTLWGALYMCIVCILPSIFYLKMETTTFDYFFGGTAILIVVGVTLDTASQIESYALARNYEGFMKKSPGKIRGAHRSGNVKGKLIQR